MKKIVVIGSNPSSHGIIRTIKKMGHTSVVFGTEGEIENPPNSDFFFKVEFNDIETVVHICKKLKVDGIVPIPVDRPMYWMAAVAERLNLNFLPLSVIDNFRHKFIMKECLIRNNINCARGVLTSEDRFEENQIESFQFPMIIKPIDGYASRGVIKVGDIAELKYYLKETISLSSNKNFIIEEFIEGREFNAEGVCYDGTVEIYAIVEKIRDPFPRTIEMGHIIPPDINKDEEKIIIDTVTNAVLALGMKNGAFNAEIMINNGIGYIIEVNGRLAGDFIVSHLIEPTTGQDMEEAVVNISLGIEPQKARRQYIKNGMISFFNLPAGKKIKKIGDFNTLYKEQNLIWAHLFFKEGDVIPEVKHMGHRSGFVIVTASSRGELMNLEEYVKNKIIEIVEFE